MPDHATDAADYLDHGRTDAATAHAILAIHEQLATIARRLPQPDIRDQIINTHHVTLRDDLDAERINIRGADKLAARIARDLANTANREDHA